MKDSDYVGRVNGTGGSPPGLIKPKWDRQVKWYIWKLALDNIADGHESIFIHWVGKRSGRWSEKNFMPLLPLLQERFPTQPQLWQATAVNCICQRHHKMYYTNNSVSKCRGISPEHPKHWLNFSTPEYP